MGRKAHKTFLVGLVVAGFLLGGALAQAGQNLVQLTVVGDSGHNQKPWEWYKKDFAEKFGVDLKIVGVPFAQVYEKEKIEFVTHTAAYDIITFYPKYLGDYAGAGYLVDLGKYAAELD
ncbi:MAG: extracellular solute-binding protein, partial [Deltaproteobacteria bacterium]|nr:extracellular solute-binding protein [Deltaproteobacteria bacterium]